MAHGKRPFARSKNISHLTKLLLNMSSGLMPENFSKEEVETLEKAFGPNWFDKFGYKEPEHKKPRCMR